MGAAGDNGGNDVLDRLNDVIEAKGSSTSGLQSFAVRNAHLNLFDETTSLNHGVPGKRQPGAVGQGRGDCSTFLMPM